MYLFAKMMQQELCRRGYGWDDDLPKDILPRWKRWLEDLDQLTALSVGRCIKPVEFGEVKKHHFADANESGYRTVTYSRMLNQNSEIQVAFLLGKDRMTECRNCSQTGVNSSCPCCQSGFVLKTELDFLVEESVFWMDSPLVLKYLNDEDRRFPYVCSQQNPDHQRNIWTFTMEACQLQR